MITFDIDYYNKDTFLLSRNVSASTKAWKGNGKAVETRENERATELESVCEREIERVGVCVCERERERETWVPLI